MDIAEKNKSNRRGAFRIYEQVDFFYHKIDLEPEIDTKLNFNHVLDNTVQSLASSNHSSTTSYPFEQLLPDSYSQENETLNANISSTGISFTSKEKLQPGDYLMIRVLLLSSMTVIMTCCKVVYVKPSNPFEKNQYPYLVGAYFVNLKLEDKELLHNHISKRRARRYIVYGLIVSFFMTVIQIPDLVLELFLNLGSFIIDNIIEFVHLIYEIIEYSLDLLIEHLFHTDLEKTQVIVFYIQIFFAIAISRPLFRAISSIFKNLYNQSRLYYFRKKSSLLHRWREKTLSYKIGLIGTGILLIALYVLFLI